MPMLFYVLTFYFSSHNPNAPTCKIQNHQLVSLSIFIETFVKSMAFFYDEAFVEFSFM
jgi:histidinol-phosphate/aromatic aminotransferase/cobyric acid decarboxylase-like protein